MRASASAPNERRSAVPPALEALLGQALDYAGLFPPARLPLDAAVDEYLDRRSGPDAWLLGPFVVPANRIDQLGSALASRGVSTPVPVAMLMPGGSVELPSTSWTALMHVAQVEVAPMARPDEIGTTVERIRSVLASRGVEDVPVYVEVPVAGAAPDAVDDAVAAIADAHAYGKVRTGGLDASAFPTAEELAGFIAAVGRHGVPWKATAGLHRPLPHVDPGDGARHHGFLPVAVAGLLASDLTDAELADLLGDPSDLQVQDDAIAWRDRRFDVPTIRRRRQGAWRSFGSCSFDEPIEGLRSLGLVGP